MGKEQRWRPRFAQMPGEGGTQGVWSGGCPHSPLAAGGLFRAGRSPHTDLIPPAVLHTGVLGLHAGWGADVAGLTVGQDPADSEGRGAFRGSSRRGERGETLRWVAALPTPPIRLTR